MKIWVIDDNPLHSSMVGAVLAKKGIEYKIFNSATDVENYILNKDIEPLPDVVFIDLHLDKGARGEDLLTFLKNNLKRKGIKYIAFTADIGSKKELVKLGFYDVIYKPITIERLELLIGDIMDAI